AAAPEPEPADIARPAEPAPAEPVPPAPTWDQVADLVRDRLAEILDIPSDQIAADRAFDELGLDSIFRMDLAQAVNRVWTLDLRGAEMYEYDTIDKVADYVMTRAPQPAADPEQALHDLLTAVTGRPLDPPRSFTDNGLTSFNMLRTGSAREKQFGSLRKTLLFDQPTVRELAAHLTGRFGAAAVAAVHPPVENEPADDPPPDPGPATGPLVVRRDSVAPELAGTVDGLDRRFGMESGLAGRDIAPLMFLGSTRQGYFTFSRRGDALLAWSFVGPDGYLPELVAEWLDYARQRGLAPNLLSLTRLENVAGVEFTSTAI